MLSEFFGENKKDKYSYGEIIQNAFFTYATFGIPHVRKPTLEDEKILSKIKLENLDEEKVKKIKTKTLVQIHNRTKIIPWYVIPQIGIWGGGFIAITYIISHKVSKNPLKYFGSQTRNYKQVFLRGTILSSIYTSYLILGGLGIFYPHHPILKMKKIDIIESELNERNCLYNEKARIELLENSLRYYKFDNEYIEKTMSMVDKNLEKMRADHE